MKKLYVIGVAIALFGFMPGSVRVARADIKNCSGLSGDKLEQCDEHNAQEECKKGDTSMCFDDKAEDDQEKVNEACAKHGQNSDECENAKEHLAEDQACHCSTCTKQTCDNFKQNDKNVEDPSEKSAHK